MGTIIVRAHGGYAIEDKKVENHACAVALHSMYYNFVPDLLARWPQDLDALIH
ncbi:MAG: hypothetical protein WBE90_28595 [Xanthobacteraceae bacterium]